MADRRHLALVAALLFLPLLAAAPATQPDLSKLSPPELARRLPADDTRWPAFLELRRRSVGGPSDLPEEDPGSRFVLCPQRDGAPPLHAVVYPFVSSIREKAEYRIDNADELFPRGDGGPAVTDNHEVTLFDAAGKVAATEDHVRYLFDGLMHDLNRDAVLEHVDVMAFGISDLVGSVTILQIRTVEPTSKPLLAVAYNWDARDHWSYHVADADRDGLYEISLGPRRPDDSVDPRVTFRWDAARARFTGPAGADGDAHRVIDAANVMDDLMRLARSNPRFPPAPPKRDPSDDEPAADAPAPAAVPATQPYRHASLKDASSADLLRFIGPGNAHWERASGSRIRTHVPAGFWQSPPKAAALAMADANRTPAHRARYPLAVDDRDRVAPPDAATIYLYDASSRCYFARDTHLLLRVDPAGSSVARLKTGSAGVAFRNPAEPTSTYDLQVRPLPYDQARHLLHAIFWLDRVRGRARPTGGTSFIGSTGDGRGTLTVAAPGRREPVVSLVDHTVWSDAISTRFRDRYTRETCLNLAVHLLEDELPTKLRPPLLEPSLRPAGIPRPGKDGPAAPGPRLDPADLAPLLRHAVDDPAALPEPLTLALVEAAGESLAPTLTPLLETLRAGPTAQAGPLGSALTLALRQHGSAADVDALHRWARARDDGFAWALARLRSVDRDRFADATESILPLLRPHEARSFFTALAEVHPHRARAVAASLSPEAMEPVAVAGFLALHEAKGIPDQPRRIAALIGVALDPAADPFHRSDAVNALVPADAPHRYDDPRVTDALLRLIHPERPRPADGRSDFPAAAALEALARRTGHAHLAAALDFFESTRHDAWIARDALATLVAMAQPLPPDHPHRRRLADLLRPHLAHSNLPLADVLLAIWSLDLRDARDRLADLATDAPDEFEGDRASSGGGPARPVTGRYHLARQIVALWSEPDRPTAARLLLAFHARHADWATPVSRRLLIDLAALPPPPFP